MSSATKATAVLAPNVNAIVGYGEDYLHPGTLRRYRVTGWMRVAPEPKFEPDSIEAILFEACQEINTKTDAGHKRMQFCLRDEATHLSLTGVCGAIAPIEHCTVLGEVEWTNSQKAEASQRAMRLGAAHKMVF